MADRIYTKHYVIDMDESMVQNCIYCGEIISDYRNAMIPRGQLIPKGFPTGDVFVLKGNPTIYATSLQNNKFNQCTASIAV